MGNRIKFLYDNYIDSDVLANFSYSSQNSGYPASNLQDPFRSKVWRSNAGNFEINSSNDALVINDGTDKTVQLTRTDHDSASALAADLQTKLNAASSNFTVTWSSTTNKFTIARTTVFSILWTNGATSCADLLGYNSSVDDTGLDSYEADSARICYPSEWIKLDFGLSRNPKGVILIDNLEENIKIQPSVTMRLQGSPGDSWNSPYNVDLPYNGESIVRIDVDGLLDRAYRWARLYIPDVDNPLGHQQMGKIYIGDVVELESSDVQREVEETAIDLTTAERAIGGELYHDERPSYDRFSNIIIQYCNKTDVDTLKAIYNTHRTHTPFFVAIDSEATATNDINEWTKYVKFAGPPKYQTVTNTIWTIRFGLEELL